MKKLFTILRTLLLPTQDPFWRMVQILLAITFMVVFFVVLPIGILLYTRLHNPWPLCFEDAPDLQPFIVAEPSGSPPVDWPRITTANVHQLTRLKSFSVSDRIDVLAVSSDAQMIAAGSIDGTIQLFNVATDETITLELVQPGGITGLAFSPSMLAASDSSGDMGLWDTNSGDLLGYWSLGRRGYDNQVLFASPHELLYSFDNLVYLCDLLSRDNRKLFDSYREISLFEDKLFEPNNADIAEIILSGDGRSVLYRNAGDADSTGVPVVGNWNFDSRTKTSIFEPANLMTDIALSPNGQRLASSDTGGIINLIDLPSNHVLPQIELGRRSRANQVALNWDGSLVFLATNVNRLAIWDVEAGSWIQIEVQNVSRLSTSENFVVTAGADGMVHIWGVAPV